MKRRLSHLLSITLLLVFIVSGLAGAVLPFLNTSTINQTVSAAGTEYVFYSPSTPEYISSFAAAFRDDKDIQKDSTMNLLKQTKVVVRDADSGLGTVMLSLDTAMTKKHHLPIYKTDYYCTPTQGTTMEKSLTTPDGSRPYVRYTYGIALDDNSAWGGLVDDAKDTTYVGVLGNKDVGDVHFPAIIDNSPGHGNAQDAKVFKIPGKDGDQDIRQHIAVKDNGNDGPGDIWYGNEGGADNYTFQNATDNSGNPIPGASSIVGDTVAVLGACMPHPKGYMDSSQKAMNYNKLNAADKAAWDQAVKDAQLGDDVGSAAKAADDNAGAGDSPGLDCKVKLFNPLTWLVCPAIKGMVNIVGDLDDLINSQMTVGSPGQSDDPNQIFCSPASSGSAKVTCQNYRTAWASFRNLALGLIAVAGLVVVIAQALGFEILDAYTIRKVLPRILIAAVAITLSWQLMQFFVTLTNDLGFGVRYLIYHPFNGLKDAQVTFSGGGAVAAGLIGAGAVAALGIFGVLSFAVTAALAVFVAFLVLIIRQMLIIVLVLVAPIAIVAYVLPNTQKVYKLWWDSFSKALLMFPIISAFIATGRVFSVVSSTSDSGGALSELISFAAYFAPYFLMPLAFRFAGGALSGIGGFMNSRSRGGFDRLKKFRGGQYQSHGARKIEGAGRRVLTKRADVNAAMQNYASGENRSWIARKAVGGAARQLAGYNLEALQSSKRADVAKEMNDQIATGRDEEIRGLLVDKAAATEANGMMRMNGGKRQYKSLGGAWVDEAHVDAGQKRWGNDNFAKQAALSYEMRKASDEEDVARIANNFGSVAKATGMSDNQAAGAWMGAAYENQNQHLEYKHTNWRDGSMSAAQGESFATEAYEKKDAYSMAKMHSATIKKLEEVHVGASSVLASPTTHTAAEVAAAQKTQTSVAGVAETFVSRYGASPGGVGGDDDAAVAAAAAAAAAAGLPGGTTGTVQTNAAGAGHVAERVRQLAVQAGVYRDLPPPTAAEKSTNPVPPNYKRQN